MGGEIRGACELDTGHVMLVSESSESRDIAATPRQDRPRVEHLSREDGTAKWTSTIYSDRSGSIEIPSIRCSLALSDIYSNIR